MLLVREVMHCRPGKVRPLVEKFLAMSKLFEKRGMGSMRILTDVAGENYWTLIAETEVESLDEFFEMDPGDDAEEFEEIMEGYHDLVDHGHREIFKIEG